MPEAHKRTKAPEAVKRRLMDAAIQIAVDTGLTAITVQAVATAAGVTKGGFLHHFPSKQSLIDAIFDEVLAQLEKEIRARVSNDLTLKGAFTRAYVDLAFEDETPAMGQTWIALSILMLDDAGLRKKWADWFHDQLVTFKEDTEDADLCIARLAVDGAWLAQYVGISVSDRKALYQALQRRISGSQ